MNNAASAVLRSDHPGSVRDLVLFNTQVAYWGHANVRALPGAVVAAQRSTAQRTKRSAADQAPPLRAAAGAACAQVHASLAAGEHRTSFQLHPSSGGLPFWEWLDQPEQAAMHSRLTRGMQRLTAQHIEVGWEAEVEVGAGGPMQLASLAACRCAH